MRRGNQARRKKMNMRCIDPSEGEESDGTVVGRCEYCRGEVSSSEGHVTAPDPRDPAKKLVWHNILGDKECWTLWSGENFVRLNLASRDEHSMN